MRSRWLRWGCIPLVYAFLTLVMTYPLVFRLGSHYAGTGSDLVIFPWNDWWCRKCLLEGRNPLYTTWLFYPQGVSLVFHNFAWLNTALWLPLSRLFGPIAAYNLIFLFNLAMGGIGMHCLVHYLTSDHRAAFVAGLIFAFWPCRMSHYNHPNMISVGWIPLFLLFLIRTIRETPKWKPALLAAVFLALTGLARWLHLLFTGGMVTVYLVYSLVFERRFWNRRTVAALALALGLALVLMAPLLSPLVMAQIEGDESAEDVFSTDPDLYSTDLVSYFIPERGHPLFSVWLEPLWSRMRRGSYFGYTALALMIVGALRGQRDRGCWLIMGVGLFILSLGPRLEVAGRTLDIRLPYDWVKDWPPVRVVRHPNRFCVPLSLPLAVLVGYGVFWLLARRRGAAVKLVVTLGMCALVLMEYLRWPYPTVQIPVPPFYNQLAAEPGDFAVLDLPMGTRTVAKSYMYYATIHGKPLVEGHVSRLPPSAHDFIDSVPLLDGLRRNNEMDPALDDISRQLSMLADAGIRYLILHPDLVEAGKLAQWRNWLTVSPIFEDRDTVVYRTRLRYGQDFDLVEEVGDGIGIISATLSASTLPQDGWLEADLVWGTRSGPGQDYLARLALVSPSGSEAQWVDFEPCRDWPTSEWPSEGGAVARGHATLHVDPFIEGGTYTVTVGLVDPDMGARAGEPVAIGHVNVQVVERTFERPEVEMPVDVLLGDALRLLGCDLRQGSGRLDLTLHWQARRRMAIAYKFFVHLLDAETEELVAQVDAMPRGWTYPTHWWEKGEVVSDHITLSLSDVPPGVYRLAVGAYDPDTGARLPVTDALGTGEVGDSYAVTEELVIP